MKIAIFSILFLLFYNILFSNSILNKIFPVVLNSQERVQINELFESISKLKPLKVQSILNFMRKSHNLANFSDFHFQESLLRFG
ncbi:hypothetical protein LEP1GSC088_2308 [Leptospira interrogans str. L1207]|nr:hypothetical protein LEP1GSC088_2308 [Leptospira interrogans str. L1207]